jgi:hypothetical protein
MRSWRDSAADTRRRVALLDSTQSNDNFDCKYKNIREPG